LTRSQLPAYPARRPLRTAKPPNNSASPLAAQTVAENEADVARATAALARARSRFLQLRETYLLSMLSALWRTATLLCVSGSAFVLFLLLIVMVSLH